LELALISSCNFSRERRAMGFAADLPSTLPWSVRMV